MQPARKAPSGKLCMVQACANSQGSRELFRATRNNNISFMGGPWFVSAFHLTSCLLQLARESLGQQSLRLHLHTCSPTQARPLGLHIMPASCMGFDWLVQPSNIFSYSWGKLWLVQLLTCTRHTHPLGNTATFEVMASAKIEPMAKSFCFLWTFDLSEG